MLASHGFKGDSNGRRVVGKVFVQAKGFGFFDAFQTPFRRNEIFQDSRGLVDCYPGSMGSCNRRQCISQVMHPYALPVHTTGLLPLVVDIKSGMIVSQCLGVPVSLVLTQ